jgi:hypothetical protein
MSTILVRLSELGETAMREPSNCNEQHLGRFIQGQPSGFALSTIKSLRSSYRQLNNMNEPRKLLLREPRKRAHGLA